MNFIVLARHYHQGQVEMMNSSTISRHLGISVQAMTNLRKDDEEEKGGGCHSRALGLLDFDYIRSHLLNEAPWAESHGSDHHLYLGAGILYYSLAYAFQCRTIVVLGSGGGFVPRILRQAQRDLERSHIVPHHQRNGNATTEATYRLILVDAHMPSAGWGATFYAENEETVMRRDFSDIRYIFQTTDQAFEVLKSEGIDIDYLHIDADHTFEQSYKDFTIYFQLLSPRGVVSFHDTCHNETRHCETGVPDTVRAIQDHPDSYGLQILDAHFLYRGIALGIRKDAPALEGPKSDRWNFCRNNVANLHKTSNGFDKNGQLDTLGSFYDCGEHYNLTRLGMPCPTGFRRSLSQPDSCLRCIPGLNGVDCRGFRFQDRRNVVLPYEAHPDLLQKQRLIAAWLADYNIQHLFEVNAIPSSKVLYHAIQSVVAVDPRMQSPLWTDDGVIPILRWLPVRYKDVLRNGDYASTVDIGQTDAVVCVDCERNLKHASELQRFMDEFPHLRILVLECAVDSTFLMNATHGVLSQDNFAWEKQAEIVFGSPTLEQQYPKHGDVNRRILLFTKKRASAKVY